MRQRPRLLAFDLDGTALKDGSVPDPLVSKLAKFARSGNILSTASGRHFDAQERILAQSGITSESGFPQFMICADKFIFRLCGAGYVELADWNEGIRRRWRRLLPEIIDRLPRVSNALNRHNLPHATVADRESWDAHGFVGLEFENVAAASAAMAVMEREVDGIAGAVINRAANFSAVTLSDAGKGEALKRIASELGLAPAEVLAVGDSYNDINMLDGRFGFQSAAVGNAEEVIQLVVRNNGGHVAQAAGTDGFAEIMEIVLRA